MKTLFKGFMATLFIVTLSMPMVAMGFTIIETGGGSSDLNRECFANCLTGDGTRCPLGDKIQCANHCQTMRQEKVFYNGAEIQDQIIIDDNGNSTVKSALLVAGDLCFADLAALGGGSNPPDPDDDPNIPPDQNRNPDITCGMLMREANDDFCSNLTGGDSPEVVISTINLAALRDSIAQTGDLSILKFVSPLSPFTVPDQQGGDSFALQGGASCASGVNQALPPQYGGGNGLGCRENSATKNSIDNCPYLFCCSLSSGCHIQGPTSPAFPPDGCYNYFGGNSETAVPPECEGDPGPV